MSDQELPKPPKPEFIDVPGFAIAKVQNECFGHGSYGDVVQVRPEPGTWDAGPLPPIFFDEGAASGYLSTLKGSNLKVVPIRVRTRNTRVTELAAAIRDFKDLWNTKGDEAVRIHASDVPLAEALNDLLRKINL